MYSVYTCKPCGFESYLKAVPKIIFLKKKSAYYSSKMSSCKMVSYKEYSIWFWQNQVYQPPKDLTTCCGSCKNLSCLHTFSNGTVSNFKVCFYI